MTRTTKISDFMGAVSTAAVRITSLVVTFFFKTQLTFAVQVRTRTLSADSVTLVVGAGVPEFLAPCVLQYY